VAEKLELSAVDIAQLAYAVDEFILCCDGSDLLFPNDFGEDLLITANAYYYNRFTALWILSGTIVVNA